MMKTSLGQTASACHGQAWEQTRYSACVEAGSTTWIDLRERGAGQCAGRLDLSTSGLV